MQLEIYKLNEHIAEITTANIAIHQEIGDLAEWLENWREDMAGLSISLFTIISVLEGRHNGHNK